MGVKEVNLEHFITRVVHPKDAAIFSSFSCGNEVIDEYFREKALVDNQNVCYAYINEKTGETVGGATVCCSGINFGNESSVQLIPAIKISEFAIDEKYQKAKSIAAEEDDPFYLSDAFLCDIINGLTTVAESYVGAIYIFLYSVPSAEHFYRRNLFNSFEDYMRPEQQYFTDGCIPMLFEL